MANRIVSKSLKHYWDEPQVSASPPKPPEPDKSKSISQLDRKELWDMLSRARDELELQRIIKELKRNSGERDTFEKPFKVDTTTPINQLYHYGIRGQKWGVRRFQNEDGTRTAAGKRRERENDSDKSDDHVKSREAKAKGAKGLSNDELRKVNERLQLEETYKRLTAEKMVKSESWVKQSIRSAGQQALTDFSKGVFLGSAKLLVKEISPQFAETAFNIKEKKKD